ncbi:MAG: Holliday junction branch migration protein RuvA [Armatimonadetes bacterium]|nr:Holliday junction branch migration protein RuvA [Armatimonadota bacterium]
MIARIRGKVIENDGSSVVVDCNGVGYEVQVPSSVSFHLPVDSEGDLFVRHVVREDDQALYGFLSSGQRRTFDMLRDVKGCGPKTSLAVIGDLGEEAALTAILTQDVKLLTRVPGVGPRLAERIIVELKDKVPQVELDRKLAAVAIADRRKPIEDELVDALVGLGYRRGEAEAAADKARNEAETVPDQLKVALRSLTR